MQGFGAQPTLHKHFYVEWLLTGRSRYICVTIAARIPRGWGRATRNGRPLWKPARAPHAVTTHILIRICTLCNFWARSPRPQCHTAPWKESGRPASGGAKPSATGTPHTARYPGQSSQAAGPTISDPALIPTTIVSIWWVCLGSVWVCFTPQNRCYPHSSRWLLVMESMG